MTIEMYYFSATGNSYDVAFNIAKKLNADLVPVVPLKDQTVKSNADKIGIVFPIYDFKAPEIINDFIHKLETPDSTYFFGVCTYGVMPLDAMRKLDKVFSSEGKELAGGFAIKTPHSGLGYERILPGEQEEMFKLAREKYEWIVSYVKSKRRGIIEKSSILDRFILMGLLFRLLPVLLPMFKQALFHGWDSLGFHVDKKCNGCGICEKVCPMDNILMAGEKPIWGDNCISCFACFHWCPQESIQIDNLTRNMERRHNPQVKLSDILKQKESHNMDDK